MTVVAGRLLRSLVLLTAAMLAAGAAASAPAGHARGARPNVIVITTDDQTAASLRPSVMPELSRHLLRDGTSFDNAIATTPLCCPARATIITGQYAHNHGVTENDYGLLRWKHNTLPVWLRRSGYRTVHVGKYLNRYHRTTVPHTRPAPGWRGWFTALDSRSHRYFRYFVATHGKRHRFSNRRPDYITSVFNRKAVRVINRHIDDRRPLMLQLDHRAPHRETRTFSEGRCSGAAIPAARDRHRFAHAPLPRPPSFNEPDVSDKPPFMPGEPFDAAATDTIRQRYRCALAALRAVDRGFGRIHRALKRHGALADTVIVFVSDNGLMQGEHRLAHGKGAPYEEALRVPLVIKVPPRYIAGNRVVHRVTQAVGNVDMAPTILDLAKARPCSADGRCRVLDGRSLVPLIAGDAATWPADRQLLIEHHREQRRPDPASCEWTGTWDGERVYVEHASAIDTGSSRCVPVAARELYDLDVDPFQLDNLLPAEPGTGAAVQAEMLAERLASLRACAGIAGRDQQLGGRPYCE